MIERPDEEGAGLLAPSEALALLNQRVRTAEPEAPDDEDETPENLLDGYGFQLGGHACWLPRTDTLALLDDAQVCAVPGAPQALAGFLLHGGELVPVWDPGLGARNMAEVGRRRRKGGDHEVRTLIVRQGKMLCGLRIQGMPRPVRLPEAMWARPAAPVEQTARWIRGYAHAGDDVWGCVDVTALASVATAS